MTMIRRIFVEKKPGFDGEARGLLADFRENLGVRGLERVRLLSRYDVCGVTVKQWRQARHSVFADPPLDEAYEETFPRSAGESAFAVEYLPGQYDQRADSAVQCLQLLFPGTRPEVATARVIVLGGTLSVSERRRIRRYCINPVDSRAAALAKPRRLSPPARLPAAVPLLKGFVFLSGERLLRLGKELELAMDAADLRYCQAYFRDRERRDPTLCEIRLLDTYWSDHCRHTTFLTAIDRVDIAPGEWSVPARAAYEKYLETRRSLFGPRPGDVCLMDLALLPMKEMRAAGRLGDVEFSEEINACTVKAEVNIDGCKEEWLDPVQERDPQPPDRDRALRRRRYLPGRRHPRSAFGAGLRLPGHARHGKRRPAPDRRRHLARQAAPAQDHYRGCGRVQLLWQPGRAGHRAGLRVLPSRLRGQAPGDRRRHRRRAEKERRAPLAVAGDAVLLVGGRTGRDGIGGATGSSKAHGEQSLLTCGAEVQKGNPPEERKLQRLFRDPRASRLIKRCNDFGAGGVAVAVGELAPGLEIDLDRVPKKYAGLDGTELAISESQERMAVVLAAANVKRFRELAAVENLEATVIARVSARPRLRLKWRGKRIVDLDRAFLDSNGARRRAAVEIAAPGAENDFFRALPGAEKLPDLGAAWKATLSGSGCLLAERAGGALRRLYRRRHGSLSLRRPLSVHAGRGQCGQAAAAAGRDAQRHGHGLRLPARALRLEPVPRRALCRGRSAGAGGRLRRRHRPSPPDPAGIFSQARMRPAALGAAFRRPARRLQRPAGARGPGHRRQGQHVGLFQGPGRAADPGRLCRRFGRRAPSPFPRVQEGGEPRGAAAVAAGRP